MAPTPPGYTLWEWTTPLTQAASPLQSPWIDTAGYTQVVPFFQEQAVPFLLWLGAAYLFTLALEVGLILSGRPAPSGAQSK